MVGRAAGFYHHQAHLSAEKPTFELGACEALGFDDAPLLIGGSQLENRLCKIDSNGSSIHVGLLTFERPDPMPMTTRAPLSRKKSGECIPSIERQPVSTPSVIPTSFSPSAFVRALIPYLEAFAEVDPTRRIELLARSMTPDAQIWGPKRVFSGYAEISAKIEGFHANWPNCRLVITAGPNTFLNSARFGSAIISADGEVKASGETVMELAEDGRYIRVLPYWEALPPLPVDWPVHLAP